MGARHGIADRRRRASSPGRALPGEALVAFAVLLLLPGVARADAGVPMLVLVLPGFALAFVPIVAVEALVLARGLELGGGRATSISLLANAISSFAGVPLTWIVLVVLQLLTGGDGSHGLDTALDRVLAVTWQAPWLIPYEGDLDWMIPAASLVLLVPFFWVSYLIERSLVRRWSTTPEAGGARDAGLDAARVGRVVLEANALTYAGLALLVTARLAWVLATRGA